LLEVNGVTCRFGGIAALDNVSFDVDEGEIVGLIGPNGAGKTTAFNVITRLYRPDSGELDFEGESLLSTPPHGVVRRGIARTFQNLELFETMTVRENVLVGTHARTGSRSADDVLAYVGLGDVAGREAGSLPFVTL
jgi:branched-chain amino acid transport system ATP-binding protein